MYHAQLGRFCGRDPVEADRNLHSYCHSSPVVCVDPLGLDGTHSFEVDGYPCQIEWAEGWFWAPLAGSGRWGQPYWNAHGYVERFANGLRTHVQIWGHNTCNTICQPPSFSNSSGHMRAYIKFCPGTYIVALRYSVKGFAAGVGSGGMPSGGGGFHLNVGSESVTGRVGARPRV